MAGIKKAGLGLFAAASILVGVGFLGLGLDTALQTVLGLAGAAIATGGLLLLPPLLWLVAGGYGLPRAQSRQPVGRTDDVLVTELARLAMKRPLLAVLAAALVGAASSHFRNL